MSDDSSLIVTTDGVARTAPDFNRMVEDWIPILDLYGGTKRMREVGTKWLPKEPAEATDKYAMRLSRSFLFNGYKETVQKQVSRPFSRTIVLDESDSLPDSLKNIESNSDKEGTTLTELGKELLEYGIGYGLTHILVDFPAMPANGEISRAVEEGMDARPLFKHIKPYNLFFWDYITDSQGTEILIEIRYIDYITVQDGKWGTREQRVIRRITTTGWEVWLDTGTSDDTLSSSGASVHDRVFIDRNTSYKLDTFGEHTFGRVPLETYYTNKKGFMIAQPPLATLADLNIEHWQSASDQTNILRFVRLAQLVATGINQEEIDNGVKVSVNNVIAFKDPNAKMFYVEHTGAGIEAGVVDLERLEQKMELLGLQSLTKRTKDVTATGAAITDSKANSDLQSWIEGLNASLLNAYQLGAEWTKDTLPEKFGVRVFKDFTAAAQGIKDVQDLQIMRDAIQITQRTFLKETKRRGMIDELVDIDEELRLTKIERDEEDAKELALATAATIDTEEIETDNEGDNDESDGTED